MTEEFYIGWQRKSSPAIGKQMRAVIASLLLAIIALSFSLAFAQRMIGTAAFEWGDEKHFSGIFRVWPYPHLLVMRPHPAGLPVTYSTYFLVAPLKYGLSPEAIAKFDDKFVTLQGALLYRNDLTMVEVLSSSIAVDEGKSIPFPLPQAVPLGQQTLTGEIVDSKCYFGAMNPGELVSHRACAIVCIEGGIPPVFMVRQSLGPPIYLLLASTAGKPVNQEVLDFVAEPIVITGQVESQDGLLVILADPKTYRRVNPSKP
jgi:hypothetical protein